jgi:hypothetical protein
LPFKTSFSIVVTQLEYDKSIVIKTYFSKHFPFELSKAYFLEELTTYFWGVLLGVWKVQLENSSRLLS